jgi:protein involved in polysaccharide export with SLBB domain
LVIWNTRNFDRVKVLLPLLGIFLGCLLLSGCAGGGSSASIGPAPTGDASSDAIRVGDKITVRLIGVPMEEQYVNEIQVTESGDITVPELTESFHAVGVRPGDLAARIAAAYRDQKIYTNPNVTVNPEERYVNITGDVRTPTRVLYTTDLTALGAISAGGGFDEYADKHHVRILRGSKIYVFDAQKATEGSTPDMIVYPGDQITVPRTVF